MAVRGFLLVTVEPGFSKKVGEDLLAITFPEEYGAEIAAVDAVTGPYEVIAQLSAVDLGKFGRVIDSFIKPIDKVEYVTTCLAVRLD